MSGVLKKVNWRQGLKTAIAAGICLALVRVLHFKQGYWACVSTIVVMQSESTDTFKASRDRLIGTALGALAGWGAASVAGAPGGVCGHGAGADSRTGSV
jgi:uncharacterized membrane protein YccC